MGDALPGGVPREGRPTWLGQVYGSGRSAKQWAKDFVRDHNLGRCLDAREIIPTMAAIDSMLMDDQPEGVVNSVSLERLPKKAFEIFVAFRDCEREEDWRPGKDAKKKSKINEEMWRRVDPSKSGADEEAFQNRALEDEIRTEVDRDAAVLKAFSKLEERKPAAPGS